MKTIFFIFTFIYFGFQVLAQDNKNRIKCDQTLIDGYKDAIVDASFESVVNGKTIRINELKFTCAASGRLSQEAMYKEFGKWDSFVKTEDEFPSLVWGNVKLFKGKDKKYTVVAHGVSHLYISFMVLDEDQNDMLSQDSDERDVLIKYFKKLIRKNPYKRNNFCEDYNEICE